jgi:hypothetical protein
MANMIVLSFDILHKIFLDSLRLSSYPLLNGISGAVFKRTSVAGHRKEGVRLSCSMT